MPINYSNHPFNAKRMNAKILLVARILLGLDYLIFGLNYFLHFIPMQPMPGDAGTFIGILFTSGWLLFVKVLEIVGGISLLTNQYSRLAAVVLAPITVSILLFHLLIAEGAAMGAIMVAINALILYGYKEDFKGMFKRN